MHVFQLGLTTVVNKIVGCQKTVTEDLTKIDKMKCHTADSMSLRRAKLNEQKYLKQLLTNLVTGPITANECLHQLGFVALNLRRECYLAMYIISLLGSLFCSEQFVCEVQL